MKYKNYQMEQMIEPLAKHLDRRDILGFAAAKNINALRNEAREYLDLKDKLIMEYGEQIIDEEGMPTAQYKLEIGSEGFEKYQKEIEVFANQEGEPKIYMVKPADVIGLLDGKEILEIAWMIGD